MSAMNQQQNILTLKMATGSPRTKEFDNIGYIYLTCFPAYMDSNPAQFLLYYL